LKKEKVAQELKTKIRKTILKNTQRSTQGKKGKSFFMETGETEELKFEKKISPTVHTRIPRKPWLGKSGVVWVWK